MINSAVQGNEALSTFIGGVWIRKELDMQSTKDVLLLNTVLEGEPRSSLWKLLNAVLKPKTLDFRDIIIPGSPNKVANFRFSA